jgi:hypothetical protein
MSTELERRSEVAADVAAGDREAELERENRRLREANRELRRANLALARDWISRRDSGAAAAIHRATEAERTLLRSQGWDEWPKPLRFLVSIALRARKLRQRLRG